MDVQQSTPPAAAHRHLPVVVIGAGPVGLAAAAHLVERGLEPLVLEAGPRVGAAVRQWGHVRTFTPWDYMVDPCAGRLLTGAGWTRPGGSLPPTGAELVENYLQPLADVLGHHRVRTGTRVVAVGREGVDKARSIGRAGRPFVVRTTDAAGGTAEFRARAVIDASGTWEQPSPLGASGLPASGEDAAREAGVLVGPLPDILGRDRQRFAGRRTLVVGMGHSAATTLLELARLATVAPGTEVVWAIRALSPERLFGGGEADQLEARGRLGEDLRSLVASGSVELVPDFHIDTVALDDDTATLLGRTGGAVRTVTGVHTIVRATGFRPDLSLLRELRLELDPGLEAPPALAPLIDPAFHSCGTVPPHGHRELSHPEDGFYVVGSKSYGRAPTFLIATGNEQARSVAAALAGDLEAADDVRLVLPETGVCSVSLPLR